MSHIISLLPRHYIGTAAEIGGITGVCGDTAYSSDTDVYYHWCGASWVVGGIPYFVERLATSPDKQVGDFTCNGNWHVDGLDLSAIVPAGAIAIVLRVELLDDAASTHFTVRRSAADTHNDIIAMISVANVSDNLREPISIASNRLLDYKASNVVITTIDLTVLGWWVPRCL